MITSTVMTYRESDDSPVFVFVFDFGVTGSSTTLIFLVYTFLGAAGTLLITLVALGETILATCGEPTLLLMTTLGLVITFEVFELALDSWPKSTFSSLQASSDRWVMIAFWLGSERRCVCKATHKWAGMRYWSPNSASEVSLPSAYYPYSFKC